MNTKTPSDINTHATKQSSTLVNLANLELTHIMIELEAKLMQSFRVLIQRELTPLKEHIEVEVYTFRKEIEAISARLSTVEEQLGASSSKNECNEAEMADITPTNQQHYPSL